MMEGRGRYRLAGVGVENEDRSEKIQQHIDSEQQGDYREPIDVLRCMFWNVEGLKGLYKNHPERLPFQIYDILCLAETFLTSYNYGPLEKEFRIYQALAERTRGRPSGGIMIAIKKHVKSEFVNATKHTVTVKTNGITLTSAYFPPDMDICEICTELADNIPRRPEGTKNILIGDFNCRLDAGHRGADLLDALEDMGLVYVGNELVKTYHSHNGSSTIDFIFVSTNCLSMMNQPRINRVIERKHSQIKFEITLDINQIQHRKKSKAVRSICGETLEQQIIQNALQINATSEVDGLAEIISNLIKQSELKPTQRGNRKGSFHKMWFDAECLAQKNRIKYLLYTEDRSYWVEAKKYKKLIKEKRMISEEQELIKNTEKYAKQPWKLIPKKNMGSITAIKAEVWEQHFGSLLYTNDNNHHNIQLGVEIQNPEPEEQNNTLTSNDIEIVDELNNILSNQEVEKAISRAKNAKATGPDDISNEIYKKNSILTPLITRLFNLCLILGVIPKIWLTTTIKPLFKGKGDFMDVNNYRGISLAPHIMKIFSSILKDRLTDFCTHKLDGAQFGFLKGKNCEQAVQELINYIKNNKKPVYAVFIDFRKAFDMVQRQVLLDRLYTEYGIQGRMFRLLDAMLKMNWISVETGREIGSTIPQNKGLAQGDSLSPFLFILFINSLLRSLRKVGVSVWAYADDLCVAASDKHLVQKAMEELKIWCETSGMEVNPSKTKVMKFKRGGRDDNIPIMYNDEALEYVKNFIYLGVNLTPGLSFKQHIDKIKIKATSATFGMGNLTLLSMDTVKQLFRIKLLPIIEYCMSAVAERMTLTNLKDIDKVKTNFLKRALGLSKFTSNTLTLEMAGEETLVRDLKTRGFSFSEDVMSRYDDYREEKGMSFSIKRYTDGPIFTSTQWKKPGQRYRQMLARVTSHGYHKNLCATTDCPEASENCQCIYCGDTDIDTYHVMYCTYLAPMNIRQRIDNIVF
jgi:hypothetical protein